MMADKKKTGKEVPVILTLLPCYKAAIRITKLCTRFYEGPLLTLWCLLQAAEKLLYTVLDHGEGIVVVDGQQQVLVNHNHDVLLLACPGKKERKDHNHRIIVHNIETRVVDPD
jgi:hypothetical protein